MTSSWQLKCWDSVHIHNNSVQYCIICIICRLALLFIPRSEHPRPRINIPAEMSPRMRSAYSLHRLFKRGLKYGYVKSVHHRHHM